MKIFQYFSLSTFLSLSHCHHYYTQTESNDGVKRAECEVLKEKGGSEGKKYWQTRMEFMIIVAGDVGCV